MNLLAKIILMSILFIQSVTEPGKKDISFTVAKTDLSDTMDLLRENRESLTAREIVSEEGVAKLSVIGAGMCSNPGVAAKMFEALYSADGEHGDDRDF